VAAEPSVRERVLVVDDDAQMRTLLERILTREGYRCTTAGAIQAGLDALNRAPYDLIVCDVGLPDGSGLDLVRVAVRRNERMAALMISGLDDVALAQQALEIGAYGYVLKPFTANEVLVGVLGALRHRRAEVTARGALTAAQEETIQRLCIAVEARDPDAAPHISQMSDYSGLIARELGLDSPRCHLIRIASAMHDVGNIGVPDRVLLKPGALSTEERAEMQRHTEIGYRILAGSPARLLENAATIAWTHHERWGGDGYPRGLSGDEIPVVGRVAAVADVFDALTRERPYRPPFSAAEALQILEDGRDTCFDPHVLEAFFRVYRRLEREAPAALAPTLTSREREVLQLAADGRSAAEIAQALVLSPGTVKTHFQNIYLKLGAHERASAVAVGLRSGLIE